MKKKEIISVFLMALVMTLFLVQGCASSKETINNKSGAQLWGENCIRCHNTPSPVDFNDQQWTTIGLHMRVRANLTKEESEKIVDFLKSAN